MQLIIANINFRLVVGIENSLMKTATLENVIFMIMFYNLLLEAINY